MTDFNQDTPVAQDATFETIDTAPAAVEAAPVANGFATLGLAPELLAAVADLGFTQPTTVQQQCIGLAMAQEHVDGKAFNDLMVSSQTGSGKTAAFLLPV
ncbi:MAG: box helicase domain protein, partial [Ramlibacter sp.]|nr:box helicase domain protein [Ramlibacter sp.]